MSEWVDAEKQLPECHDVLKVRRKNGDEVKAYYYSDGMAWVQFYGVKTSRFQDRSTLSFLFDVTHWLRRDD